MEVSSHEKCSSQVMIQAREMEVSAKKKNRLKELRRIDKDGL